MRDNPDHTAGREPTEAEKRRLQMALMLDTLDPRDYPSRQVMRQVARKLLKDAEWSFKRKQRAKLTRSTAAERAASKTTES